MAFVDLIAAGVAAAAEAAVTAGTVVGNVGGAIASSVLPAAIGGGEAGAGGIGSMLAATEAGASGGILSGTSLAPEAASAAAPAVTPGTEAVGNTAAKTGAQIAQNAADKSFTGFGKFGDTLATNAILNAGQQGIGAIQQGQNNAQSRKVGNQIAAQQGWGSFSHGGYAELHAAHGGSVHVRDGSFVIPADVVSALGNGSSKAGARFLTHFFASLERGPAPEAGNLAADRAMQRHARRSAA